MSVEHLAAVLHHSRATGTRKLILLGIANHAGDGGSWPTVGTLARYANVDRSNARKAIKALEELGEVARHVQAGGTATTDDRDRPNLYEVLVECPDGCAGGSQHRPRRGYRRTSDGDYIPVDRGGAETPPRGDSAPPPPGGSAPLTIPTNPVDPVSSTVTVPAREARDEPRHLDTRPCRDCAAPDELLCLRRQMRLSTEDRHPYNPPDRKATDHQRRGHEAGSAGSG